MNKKVKILLLTLTSILAIPSYAETSNNTLQIGTKLENSCIFTASDVVFGNYDPQAKIDHIANQSVTIRCTKNTAWTFYEHAAYYSYAGATNSTGVAAAMVNNGNKLYYQMQMSDGVWDNDMDQPGRPNSGRFVGKGNGINQNLTLNFRIMKNQYVTPGNYKDSVTTYIEF